MVSNATFYNISVISWQFRLGIYMCEYCNIVIFIVIKNTSLYVEQIFLYYFWCCMMVFVFIGKLDIFSLMRADDHWTDLDPQKCWVSSYLGLRQYIGQSDVKHVMTPPIKAITSVLKASTDIITNIPARAIRLAEILVIMSVSTFNTAVILYIIFIVFCL